MPPSWHLQRKKQPCTATCMGDLENPLANRWPSLIGEPGVTNGIKTSNPKRTRTWRTPLHGTTWHGPQLNRLPWHQPTSKQKRTQQTYAHGWRWHLHQLQIPQPTTPLGLITYRNQWTKEPKQQARPQGKEHAKTEHHVIVRKGTSTHRTLTRTQIGHR